MKQKVEVELIPWAHRISSTVHGELIDYIKKVPKNSIIALEISQKLLDKIPDFLDIEQLEDMALSLVELVLECKKRGIKILPLESIVSDAVGDRILRKRFVNKILRLTEEEDVIGVIKENAFREINFARRISSIIKNFPQSKLIVITGYGHTKSVQTELKKLGINSKINATYSKEKLALQRVTYYSMKLRQAFEANDETKMLELTKSLLLEMQKLQKERRTGYWYGHVMDIVQSKTKNELKRRQKKPEKAKRKLAQRKRV